MFGGACCVPAAEGESGGRDADHLRLQPAHLPVVHLPSLASATTAWGAPTSGAQVGLRRAGSGDVRRLPGQSYLYTVFYIVLIYFFCYFWTAITFNPKDMAENLKDYGSFIPGYRPGKRTADYLEKVMLRITYVGAAFLSLVAVIPSVVQNALNVDYTIASFLGGTGLLIVISVCLDLVQKIDSHLIMRNYSGLVSKR
ncbi:MAG: SecY family transport protein [Isosphaeraceae bacterium]